MPQVNITNNQTGKFSLDVALLNGRAVRASIPAGGTVDVGDQCTIDELNEIESFKNLVLAGKLSVKSEVEANDIAEEPKLFMNVFMGQPAVAAATTIVAALDPVADGALTIAAQPDCPRNLTVTITDANNSVTTTTTITGKDPQGRTIVEVAKCVLGTGKVFTGTKIFASVTSAVVSGTSGAASGDTVSVGIGSVIGLPTDINNATAVGHVYLGGARQTSPVIATGISTSGVNASAGTYNGTKALMAVYNTGG